MDGSVVFILKCTVFCITELSDNSKWIGVYVVTTKIYLFKFTGLKYTSLCVHVQIVSQKMILIKPTVKFLLVDVNKS